MRSKDAQKKLARTSLREVVLRLPVLSIANWVTENTVSDTFKRIACR